MTTTTATRPASATIVAMRLLLGVLADWAEVGKAPVDKRD